MQQESTECEGDSAPGLDSSPAPQPQQPTPHSPLPPRPRPAPRPRHRMSELTILPPAATAQKELAHPVLLAHL